MTAAGNVGANQTHRRETDSGSILNFHNEEQAQAYQDIELLNQFTLKIGTPADNSKKLPPKKSPNSPYAVGATSTNLNSAQPIIEIAELSPASIGQK
jgi:hypothetical protein